MSNEIQELTERQQQWLQQQGIDESMWRALQNSLFPGSKPASLQMYWSYCKARGLDPMKKPAHIVPMSVKDSRTGEYVWQDVIMPGIAEARITANRTREYMGQDEAEFGPDVEHNIGGFIIEAPAYCTVRVHRQMGHRVATFSHTEFFEEAVSTTKDGKPNAMWKKRKRGQLAKCAEAGALRKAFPEELGGEIYADEAHPYNEMDVTPQQPQARALDALRPATRTKKGESGAQAGTETTEPDFDPETGETTAPDETPSHEPAEGHTEQGEQPDPNTLSESDLPGPNGGEAQQFTGPESHTTESAGAGEVVDPPQQQSNKVELFDADGSVKGTYQRAGSFLNALIKVLQGKEGTELEKAWHANRPVVDRIRSTGKHADRLAEIDEIVGELEDQANQDWLDQYETGQNEDAQLEEKALQGVENLVAVGDVGEIRERIRVAGKITNPDTQSRVLDTLDEALTEAKGDE